MKTKTLLIVLCGIMSLLFFITHTVSGNPSDNEKARTMSITGPVASVRSLGRNVVFEFGGPWRRRFAAVVIAADVTVPMHELSRQYLNRTVTVSGPMHENRGRFEIQLRHLNEINILDPITDAPRPVVEPTVPWPLELLELTKEVKKLRREIQTLKQQQTQQQLAIKQLQSGPKPKVERYYHGGGDYRDLDHRVRRIEAVLDGLVQISK